MTEEDIQQRLKSGQLLVNDRIGWARTYLKKAGLVDSPERSMFCLTDEGKKAYAAGVDKITLEYLQQYRSFQEFTHAGRKKDNQSTKSEPVIEQEKSPQELIEYAMDQLNTSLPALMFMYLTNIREDFVIPCSFYQFVVVEFSHRCTSFLPTLFSFLKTFILDISG